VLIGSSPVLADDFPETSAAAQYSMTRGFRQSSLPLLRRLGGDGPDSVSAALLGKLCPNPCANAITRNPGSFREITSGSWSLQILGDGTGARFRNLDVGRRTHSLAEDESQKASGESLIRLGQAYISENLASVIVLGTEERLVPSRTDYRIEAGQDLRTQQVTRTVVANRIVFGRLIRGVPVVGGGSAVVLTFANDGALESFQYDWPKYEIANPVSVVDIGGILDRVQKVVGLRMGIPISSSPRALPRGQGPGYDVELTRNTVLQKLECGYYDPGFVAREPGAPVQPGCVYKVLARSESGTRMGIAGAIPGTALIEPDAGWREAVTLRGPGAGEKPIMPETGRMQ
jgi:hypothetical protein